VVREVEVGIHPKVIVAGLDDRHVFVANWSSGTVSVVDAARGEVIARLDGGKRPRGMAMTAAGTLIVDAMWDHELRTFSAATLRQTGAREATPAAADAPRIPPGGRRGAGLPRTPPDLRLATCRFPRHAVVDRQDTLFVTCSGDDSLRWHALPDGRVLGEVSVGENPRTFALSDDGRYAAVANFDASSVTLVDLVEGRSHTTRVPKTDRLVGLAIARGERLRVFVTSWGNNELVELTLAE
jgi:YVTN family beta-propeller protein